tara:strand:+ start:202 stop:1083 length:882 start_codon:yes stop_codon:yes gene_type:complete
MISISQEKNIFYYIHWVPSEKGPLVLDYGKEIIKEKSKDFYYNALNAIRIKTEKDNFIYSLSIDSNSVMCSETIVDDSFDHFDILNWFNENTLGDQGNSTNEIFHYQFSDNQKKYLNIYFKSNIKNKIKLFAQDYNSEIRNIGLGIFSAEITARSIYNADYNNSYAVLKVAKDSEVLVISKGQLVSYLKFNVSNKKLGLKKIFGDKIVSKNFLKELENLIFNKNKKINSVEHLYFYQGKGKFKIIENLITLKKTNITSMNIFSKLKLNNKKKMSDIDGMQFAETGSSFWGIDV